DALMSNVDSVISRKFGIVKQTGILDRVTPEQIQQAASQYDLDIELEIANGKTKILLPSEKSGAKEVLDFLCEGRFIGALTNELFTSNSHRPVNQQRSAGGAKKKAAKKKGTKKKSAKKKKYSKKSKKS